MRRAALIIIVVIASLAIARAANAHTTPWFWNAPAAEYELVKQNLRWYDTESGDRYTDNVIDAQCVGKGRNYRFSDGTRGGFKHFRCTVWTNDDQKYLVFVHVTGKHRFDYRFLRYLNSYDASI